MRVVNECLVKGAELLDQYMRMAFADITDFVKCDKYGNVKIKDLSEIDGQLITEIQQRPSGFTIKLADKMKALEKVGNNT